LNDVKNVVIHNDRIRILEEIGKQREGEQLWRMLWLANLEEAVKKQAEQEEESILQG
jgi:hypothetical protein